MCSLHPEAFPSRSGHPPVPHLGPVTRPSPSSLSISKESPLSLPVITFVAPSLRYRAPGVDFSISPPKGGVTRSLAQHCARARPGKGRGDDIVYGGARWIFAVAPLSGRVAEALFGGRRGRRRNAKGTEPGAWALRRGEGSEGAPFPLLLGMPGCCWAC